MSLTQVILLIFLLSIVVLPFTCALMSKKVHGSKKFVFFLVSLLLSWVGYLLYYFFVAKKQDTKQNLEDQKEIDTQVKEGLKETSQVKTGEGVDESQSQQVQKEIPKERKPMNKGLKWVGIVAGVVILIFIGRGIFVERPSEPKVERSPEPSIDRVNVNFTGNEKDRDQVLAQISANKVISCPGCNLAGIGLEEEYVDYGSTGLNGADLSGANLQKARLPESLKNANLSNADLEDTSLWGSDLSGADLRGSNLTSTTLSNGKLIGADLRDANLFKTELYMSDLSEANLEGQDLRNSLVGAHPEWDEIKSLPEILDEVERLRIRRWDKEYIDFKLEGLMLAYVPTIFDKSNLRKADLRGMTLSMVSFEGADLTESNLTDADLKTTNLRGANLTGATLTNVTWDATLLENANLLSATLDANAMIKGVYECQVSLPTGDVVQTNSRSCMLRQEMVEKKRKEDREAGIMTEEEVVAAKEKLAQAEKKVQEIKKEITEIDQMFMDTLGFIPTEEDMEDLKKTGKFTGKLAGLESEITANLLSKVKSSRMASCPDQTLEEIFDDRLGSPKWKSAISSEGIPFVNITGRMTYRGKPETLMIQFAYNVGDGLKWNVLKIDGQSQPKFSLFNVEFKSWLCGSKELKE